MRTIIILKRIRISILLSCIFSLIISSFSTCLAQKYDGIKELESRSEFLKLPEGMKQVWQIQSSDEEIDQVIPFSESKVLLKTIHFKDYYINYKYSNLSMINMEDGSIDWTFSTLDLEQKRQDIITTAPVILIYAISNKKSGFYAVNPTDGKLLWNYPIDGNPCYNIPDDHRSLFISFKEKDKLINESLSLESGTKIWNNIMTIDSDKDLNLPRLFTGRDLYMILGETIMALNKADGKLIWKNSIKDGILSYFFSGEYLWLYNYHQVISLDLNEGKIQTEFLIPEKYISVATIYNNMLFASVYDSTKQVQELVCEDIKSVRTNWTLPVGSSLKSAIYYDNNNLFFTTEKAIYKIDTNSGTVITNIVLADSLQATTLAFDIIEKRDENFLIARENNLLIISEKEKTPKINIPFGITGGFTPSYMQNKINELRLGCIPDRSKSTYNTMNLYSNMTITGFSRQYQNWVFSSTASTLAYNSNASHSERISALNRREQAVRNSYNAGKTEAYSQLVMAYGQLGSAIGGLLAAISQALNREAFFHIIDYMEEKLKASISYQTNCINGNFYIRPYFENGWRLAVFNINKLGYASIPMMPYMPILRYSCTGGTVVYSIFSRDNKLYLLTKGLKPLPRESTDVYKFKVGTSECTMPKPSLIFYDITNIVTESKFPVLKSIQVNARPIDKELIEAAFLNDIKKVEELLKNGANVNANDEYGHTALMHACQSVNKKMVKMLLEAGANPKKEDPEGYTSLDYTSFEFPPYDNDYKDIFKLVGKAIYNTK